MQPIKQKLYEKNPIMQQYVDEAKLYIVTRDRAYKHYLYEVTKTKSKLLMESDDLMDIVDKYGSKVGL